MDGSTLVNPGPRVTVNLTRRAIDALDAICTRTGDNRTDAINRALVVYQIVLDLIDRGDGRGLMVRNADGESERLFIL